MKRIRSFGFKFTLILPVLLLSFFVANSQTPGLQWAFGLGSSYDGDDGTSITIGKSGNIYAAGIFNGSVDFDPGLGYLNLVPAQGNAVYIAKYTPDKKLLWAKSITGNNTSFITKIITDSAENIYITGGFYGTTDFDPSSAVYNLTAKGNEDTYLAKYDATGNFIWAKLIGGSGNEFPFDIVADRNGNMYITGYFTMTVDFDPSAGIANVMSSNAGNNYDIYLAKYDTSGKYIWVKSIDAGTSTGFFGGIAIDHDNNIIMTGNFTGTKDFDPSAGIANLTSVIYHGSGSYSEDIFLGKYDSSGNFIWVQRMGGDDWDFGYQVAIDKSNNILLCGRSYGKIDFDPSPDSAFFTLGKSGLYFAKYNTNGKYLWAKITSATEMTTAKAIVSDNNNNVFLAGSFAGSTDFDPSAGTATLIASSGTNAPTDAFIAKYDSLGTYLWAIGMGGDHNDVTNAISVTQSGNIYATGSFNTFADFDPSGATTILSSNGNKDIFIAKYAASSIGMVQNSSTLSSYISPNPFHERAILKLKTELTLTNVQLNIFDVEGRRLKSVEVSTSDMEINANDLASGLYYYEVSASGITIAKGKFMLQ